MPFDKARTAVQGNASPLIPVHAAESHSHRDGSATAAAQSDAQGQVPVQSRYNPVESAKAKHLCLQLQTRLRYAKLKIDYGWQTQGLEEVENLWTHAQPKPKTASGGRNTKRKRATTAAAASPGGKSSNVNGNGNGNGNPPSLSSHTPSLSPTEDLEGRPRPRKRKAGLDGAANEAVNANGHAQVGNGHTQTGNGHCILSPSPPPPSELARKGHSPPPPHLHPSLPIAFPHKQSLALRPISDERTPAARTASPAAHTLTPVPRTASPGPRTTRTKSPADLDANADADGDLEDADGDVDMDVVGAIMGLANGNSLDRPPPQQAKTLERPQQAFERPVQQVYDRPAVSGVERVQQVYGKPQQTYDEPHQAYDKPQQTYEYQHEYEPQIDPVLQQMGYGQGLGGVYQPPISPQVDHQQVQSHQQQQQSHQQQQNQHQESQQQQQNQNHHRQPQPTHNHLAQRLNGNGNGSRRNSEPERPTSRPSPLSQMHFPGQGHERRDFSSSQQARFPNGTHDQRDLSAQHREFSTQQVPYPTVGGDMDRYRGGAPTTPGVGVGLPEGFNVNDSQHQSPQSYSSPAPYPPPGGPSVSPWSPQAEPSHNARTHSSHSAASLPKPSSATSRQNQQQAYIPEFELAPNEQILVVDETGMPAASNYASHLHSPGGQHPHSSGGQQLQGGSHEIRTVSHEMTPEEMALVMSSEMHASALNGVSSSELGPDGAAEGVDSPAVEVDGAEASGLVVGEGEGEGGQWPEGHMVIPTFSYGDPNLTYDSFWTTHGMGKAVRM